MESSELFRKHSHCIFASKAQFWPSSHIWDEVSTIEDNVTKYLPSLDKYVKHLNDKIINKTIPIDSFVIEAPASIYSQSMGDVAEWLHRVLFKISPECIEEVQSLTPEENGAYIDTGWSFRYANIAFFVLTTTPLYAESHSRFCGGNRQDKVIMHLQPMYSFEYHFSQSKLGSEWDIINKIRNTFKKFGRDYKQDFPHTVTKNTNNRLHEAPKYLKPLNKNDSIITWWKYPVNFVFKK